MIDVLREIEVGAEPGAVWRVIGDFGRLDAWHPGVRACRLEAGPHGPRRVVSLADGDATQDRAPDQPTDHAYAYTMVPGGPLPVSDYRAELRAEAAGPGRTRVTWAGRFTAEGTSDDEVAARLGTYYDEGLVALPALLGR